MSRRIMRSFKLNEISAVDRPAQKGARMTILKRDGQDDLRTASPHQVEKGIDMTTEELKKLLDDAAKAIVADIAKNSGKAPTEAEITAQIDAAVSKAVAKAVADTKTTMEADFAKRQEAIAKDETFEAEGVTIRKSEVGESTFKLMKAQAERIELNDFSKRAETEIPTLVGETTLKAKCLRAISKLEKEVREGVEAMLKGGEAFARLAMKAKGHDHVTGTASENTAAGKLEKLAKEHAAKTNSDFAKAYSQVLETPEGQRLYAEAEADRKAAVKAA